ncbi:MAG: hypothetical protein KIS73_22580 [Enhydrobacter sp.]|nr:hypothetical protein [Enhydrobacter sp.]
MRYAVRRLLLALGFVLPSLSNLGAIELPTGPLPVHVDLGKGVGFSSSTMLVIEGRVTSDGPTLVVLRIDDDWSDDFASRVNEERSILPGPFRWELPLRGLKTSGGRLLRHDAVRGIHFFRASPKGLVELSGFRFEQAPRLPQGSAGFSLGSADAPLFPGFERIAPGDPRLEAGKPVAVRRPGVDPLIASGMRGVERLKLPWPSGRASVTLWTEDVGEWETLPYALRRRIRINGIDVSDESVTPQQWIESRYLAGRDAPYKPGDDAWQTYGHKRGGRISADVDVGADGIVVELAGDTAAATFLSAIVVSPERSGIARDQIERKRRDWFNAAWPVRHGLPKHPEMPNVHLPSDGDAIPTLHISVAAGTGGRAEFHLSSSDRVGPISANVVFDATVQHRLSVDLWSAELKLVRESTGGNLLVASDRQLRAGVRAGSPDAPVRHVLWIGADALTPSGRYRGTLYIGEGASATSIPLIVDVGTTVLPPVEKFAGYYLERPVHLDWFAETAPDAKHQLECDMSFLSRFGITGNAPPLPAPFANRESDLVGVAQQALQNATAAPWLAYAAAKRLREQLGPDGSARQIASVLKTLSAAGLPAPVWSVADEPSNADQGDGGLRQWLAAIRQHAPGARVAGHLNAANDFALRALFDVVLVNQGFGIDAGRLASVTAGGTETWLYNTGKPRFSAGLWLWRTSAVRFLQWHARMPTADPFDPTDGREGDVQAFAPQPAICAHTPDIDEGVLEMAEGLVDQRWLLWLDREPRGEPLRRRLIDRLGTQWRAASTLDGAAMNGLRQEIEALARSLK